MSGVMIEGLSIDAHRALYPHRWRSKARAWGVLRRAVFAVGGGVFFTYLSRGKIDAGVISWAGGFLIAHLSHAIWPRGDLIRWNHVLDGKPLWRRILGL